MNSADQLKRVRELTDLIMAEREDTYSSVLASLITSSLVNDEPFPVVLALSVAFQTAAEEESAKQNEPVAKIRRSMINAINEMVELSFNDESINKIMRGATKTRVYK